MPYDLWVRSVTRPPAFEPERIPLAPIADRYAAAQVGVGYAAADREVLLVEVDDAGHILLEMPSADELNHMAQGAEAVRGPSIIRWDGAETPVAIALGTSGEIVDTPETEAADDAASTAEPKEPDALSTTRYDSAKGGRTGSMRSGAGSARS